jgi:hypothetical protein
MFVAVVVSRRFTGAVCRVSVFVAVGIHEASIARG